MGMSYWAEIIVGLPHKDVDEELSNQIREDEFYDVGIEDKSPYYDGGGCGLFGITIKASEDYGYSTLNVSVLPTAIEEAKHIFFKHIGIEPKVYLTTRGC